MGEGKHRRTRFPAWTTKGRIYNSSTTIGRPQSSSILPDRFSRFVHARLPPAYSVRTLFIQRRTRVAENANANCAYQFSGTSPFRTGHLSRVTFKRTARKPISAVRVYRLGCTRWFFRPVFLKLFFWLYLSDRVQAKLCTSLRVWKRNSFRFYDILT